MDGRVLKISSFVFQIILMGLDISGDKEFAFLSETIP